jgi:two-component system KDP operon response regulator KdpE
MEEFRVIIADEETTAQPIADTLRLWGSTVQITPHGNECLNLCKMNTPDLALVAISLPDLSDLEVLVCIRACSCIPVLMIGHPSDKDAKLKSYELGAVGYLDKPVDITDLLARCTELRRRAVIQRDRDEPQVFSWENIVIDFRTMVVTVSGFEVPLSPTEFNLLRELVKNRGAVLTYEHILERVWANEYNVGRDAVHTYIRRLRAKLEDNLHQPRYIISKPRVGYLLNVPQSSYPATSAGENIR